jgi:hypothetical protein
VDEEKTPEGSWTEETPGGEMPYWALHLGPFTGVVLEVNFPGPQGEQFYGELVMGERARQIAEVYGETATQAKRFVATRLEQYLTRLLDTLAEVSC